MNLKIITGKLKGQIISTSNNNVTHPMSEKIRGAIFNFLGDIEDLTILDAFAGTGSFSFEAISRGAKSAVVIENNKKSQTAILQTITRLKLKDSVCLIKTDNIKWSIEDNNLYDIIFLDPPYDKVNALNLLILAKKVKKSGLIIISIPTNLSNVIKNTFVNFELKAEKIYNTATVLAYQPI